MNIFKSIDVSYIQLYWKVLQKKTSECRQKLGNSLSMRNVAEDKSTMYPLQTCKTAGKLKRIESCGSIGRDAGFTLKASTFLSITLPSSFFLNVINFLAHLNLFSGGFKAFYHRPL